MDPWLVAIIAYGGAASLTFAPTIMALLQPVKLNPGGKSFEESPHFSTEAKERLISHYTRMNGTLGFWKNKAALYTRFHYYSICWTILSAWAVPLIGAIAPQTEGSLSKWLVVAVSSHVALALSLHRGMKVAEGMKAFRHGESEFYDLYRRLLDRPQTLGSTENEQVDNYFQEVETIRKFVRHAETQTIPDLDELKGSNGTGAKLKG